MLPKGLKPGIVTTLVLLISVAMLLVNLVMFAGLRKELLHSRIDNALTLMAVAAPQLIDNQTREVPGNLTSAMDEADAGCLLIINQLGETIIIFGNNCEAESRMRRKADNSMATGEPDYAFHGRRSGGVLPGMKNLLVSYPFRTPDNIRHAADLQLSLDS